MVIQVLTLIWTVDKENRRSDLLITVLSMFFSIVSILLSVFEHAFLSKYVKNGAVMIIKFVVESQEISQMSNSQFKYKVIFSNVSKFIHSMTKMLQLNKGQVERLIPMQSIQGATFVIIVDADSVGFDQVWKAFNDCVKNGMLPTAVQDIYNLTGSCNIPQDKAFRIKLNENRDVDIADLILSSTTIRDNGPFQTSKHSTPLSSQRCFTLVTEKTERGAFYIA